MPAVLLCLSLVAFALLAVLVSQPASPVWGFDRWVSDAALEFARAHPAWQAAAEGVTATGALGVLGPAVTLLGGVLLARRQYREAAFVWTAMIFTVLARDVVVRLIARPRPVDQLVAVSSFSFPSGHSTASATAAVLLILAGRWSLPSHRARAVLTVVAGLWALAVGVSRVALVVHWPSDVVGAWLFAAITLSATALCFRATA